MRLPGKCYPLSVRRLFSTEPLCRDRKGAFVAREVGPAGARSQLLLSSPSLCTSSVSEVARASRVRALSRHGAAGGPAICETLRPHLSVDLRFGLLPLFGRAATGDGIPGTTIAACPSCHSFGVRGRLGHTISGRVFNVSEVLRRHSRMTRFAVRSSRARDVGDPNALGSKDRRSAIPRPTYRQARRESLATDRSRAAARGTASAEPDARPSRLRAAAIKEQK